MANINANLLVRGARGNVGKQFVYRKHGNSTFIAKMPSSNPNAEGSEAQLEKREVFGAAAMYANGAIKDADLKKAYQKKAPAGKSAFNMAMRDYLKAPVVKKVNTSSYNGTPGSAIVVYAKDDFRVVAVKVSIYVTSTNQLLEEGNAILDPIHLAQWIYTATQAHATLEDLTIIATATDLPGNTGALTVSVV